MPFLSPPQHVNWPHIFSCSFLSHFLMELEEKALIVLGSTVRATGRFPEITGQFVDPGRGVRGVGLADGNVFITGYTDGLMPASLSGLPAGVQLNQPAGGEDLFIAKLSSALGTIQSIHPTAP